MNALFAIIRNTFLQTIRQPIFGFMILLTGLVLVLSLPLTGWTMSTNYSDSDQIMLQNVGLTTLLFFGALTAGFCASSVISRELQDQTAMTVIAKPVPRSAFVLGKFVGVGLAVTLAYYIFTLMFLFTVRHGVVSAASTPIQWPTIILGLIAIGLAVLVGAGGNYLFGWSFIASLSLSLAVTLTAGLVGSLMLNETWQFLSITESIRESLPGNLFMGVYLIYLGVILLTAVATAGSTRLGWIATILLCLAVLIGGSWAPFLMQQITLAVTGPGGDTTQPVIAARAVGLLLPDMTVFYPLDALSAKAVIPFSLAVLTTAYFLCFTGAVLCIGAALFQTQSLQGGGASQSMPGVVSSLAFLGRISAIALAAYAVAMSPQSRMHTAVGVTYLVVLGIAGVALWLLTGAFVHRKKWAWWLSLTLSALTLAWSLPASLSGPWTQTLRLGLAMPVVLTAAVISGVLLGLLVLSETRNHFKAG